MICYGPGFYQGFLFINRQLGELRFGLVQNLDFGKNFCKLISINIQ